MRDPWQGRGSASEPQSSMNGVQSLSLLSISSGGWAGGRGLLFICSEGPRELCEYYVWLTPSSSLASGVDPPCPLRGAQGHLPKV
jgi:hypothetical protein